MQLVGHDDFQYVERRDHFATIFALYQVIMSKQKQLAAERYFLRHFVDGDVPRRFRLHGGVMEG